MYVFSIIPSVPYINGIVAKLRAEKLKEIYNRVMQIVGINEIDDEKRLIRAFIEQYAKLWPVIGEEQNELCNQLSKIILAVRDN